LGGSTFGAKRLYIFCEEPREIDVTDQRLTRRRMLTGAAALLAAAPQIGLAQAARPVIHVVKDPNCGCCTAWIAILERAGFEVTTEDSFGTHLMRYKFDNGIPQQMVSCHTGRIGGYMIEGHVPAADIRRLLDTRPDAVGLAVPGMPYGSPGMGPETARDPYDVFLIRRDGTTEVFNSYGAA
jgi:Predicted metal-binding protein